MSQRNKTILLLAATQAVCLIVGLWMQNRFIFELADWNLDQQRAAASADQAADSEANLDRSQFVESAMNQAQPLVFLWVCGLQTVVAYLIINRIHSVHAQREEQSQGTLVMKAKELARTRDAVTFGLAKLAESRDTDTGRHLERIALYSTRLAKALRRHPKYRELISPNYIQTLGVSSALHDIGKVGIPDQILLKPGKLTDGERKKMQTHSAVGGDCLRQIEQRLGSNSFLSMAREIAYYHHERWDGMGYPTGRSGEQIPLAARIVSVADVYDALVSKRSYKEAMSHEQSIEIIASESGKQFDPDLVQILLSVQLQFKEISDRYRINRLTNHILPIVCGSKTINN